MVLFYLMLDYSTTTPQILILFTLSFWASYQLCNSIRYVSVTLKPRKLQSCIVEISIPSPFVLNSRLLYNYGMDFDSVYPRLVGLTIATQLYKVHLCYIETQDVAILYAGDSYM